MTRCTRPCVAVLAVSCAATVFMLSGCATASRWVGITQPDPLAAKAAAQLATLQADPQVAQLAPQALLDAVDAVHDAQHPSDGKEHAHHLAFVAEKRVQIARAITDLKTQHAAYEALLAQRNAMGGGDASITTLAQAMPAPASAPESAPTPVQSPPSATTSPAESAPVPERTPPMRPVAPSIEVAPSPPIAASATGAQAASPSAPIATVEPGNPASSAPAAAAGNGALMTFAATDFDAQGRLASAARDAMYDLLPKFVRAPKAKIVVSGANAAHVTVVRAQLQAFGVPPWRLAERHAGERVTIFMEGATPAP